MTGRTRFNVAVAVIAALAVGGVAIASSGVLEGDGEDEPELASPAPRAPAPVERRAERAPREPAAPRPASLPQNPDELPGTDPRALTRAANLTRALAELERRRTRVEGVFDGLRVAPGRIDTTIDTPDRKLHVQIRPDLSTPFTTDSAFPNANDPDWRKDGIGARDVDPTVPERMLAAIDRSRGGSAARDIDYFVIRRDIIDGRVSYGAYFKRGPRPRIVLLEDGRLRGVG